MPKKAQPRVTPYPVVTLTDEMLKHFAELARRGVVDDVCPACQSAQGLPKILRDGRTQWICVPCVLTLYHYKYTFDLFKWRLLRLPFYRDWLNNPDKVALQLMKLTNQESYRTQPTNQ